MVAALVEEPAARESAAVMEPLARAELTKAAPRSTVLLSMDQTELADRKIQDRNIQGVRLVDC
jgi:hypothetical protein